MRNSDSFRAAIRRGTKGSSRHLVVHSYDAGHDENRLVGFVVSKAVGSAVTRNRVKRQLRHLMRDQLAGVPEHRWLVVRALPDSGSASFQQLQNDLKSCLRKISAREARVS